MKKLIIALGALLLAGCEICPAQTNGYKISAYPQASTPLSGNEVTVLNQGGTTKQATIAQIINAATSQAAGGSNALWQTLGAATNNLNSASNSLVAQISATASSTATAAAASANGYLNSASNILYLTNILTAATGTFASNALQTQITATTATANTTAATLTANANTFANAITNGGNASIGILTLTNLLEPSVQWSSTINGANGATSTVPLNVASTLRATINPAANGVPVYVIPGNMADGQNVTILVKNISSGNSVYLTCGTTVPSAWDLYVANGAIVIQPGKSGIMSFSVLYTNIIYSGANIN